MPLLSIYSLALEQDLEFGYGMVQAVGTLQTQTFMQVGCAREARLVGGAGVPHSQPALFQPLNLRRLEHEKRRKEIKELWHRAQRKLVPVGTDRQGAGRLASEQLQSQAQTAVVSCSMGTGCCGLCLCGAGHAITGWSGSCLKDAPAPSALVLMGGPRPPAPAVVGSHLGRKGATVAGRSKSGLEGD